MPCEEDGFHRNSACGRIELKPEHEGPLRKPGARLGKRPWGRPDGVIDALGSAVHRFVRDGAVIERPPDLQPVSDG